MADFGAIRQESGGLTVDLRHPLFGPLTARAAEARAQAWQPWRAYAVLRLWNTLGTTP